MDWRQIAIGGELPGADTHRRLTATRRAAKLMLVTSLLPAFLLLVGAGQPAGRDAASPTPPPAGPNAASYIADADYPAEAIRNHEQGTVVFELDVSPEGNAVACRVTQSSGSAILDRRTCELLVLRARFRPARDAAGHPVRDTVSARIRWVLP
jgi:protein TonB